MYWEEVPSPVQLKSAPAKKKKNRSNSNEDISNIKSKKVVVEKDIKHDHAQPNKKAKAEKVSGTIATSKKSTNDVKTSIKSISNKLAIETENNKVSNMKATAANSKITTKKKSKADDKRLGNGDKIVKNTAKELSLSLTTSATTSESLIDYSQSSSMSTIKTTKKVHKKEKKADVANTPIVVTPNASENNFLTLNDVSLPPPVVRKGFNTSLCSGNTDDKGSVGSGILDEDICYECGISTVGKEDWDHVVLCDICDSEYHLKCVGLDRLPRTTFVCLKCEQETVHQSKLKFNVMDEFKISKSKEDRSVVYSPSKPLELAWLECQKKGLMVVSQVFSYELMQQLTHGRLEKLTKSGRIAEQWLGATEEVDKRLHSSVCEGLVDREGRFDLRLPQFVVDQLQLEQILAPITDKLATIMGTPKPQIRTHNIVFVPVGSKPQKWHVDDTIREGKIHRYFTILIHLNSLDAGCGGTEMWIEKQQSGDMVRSRPGDAFVFNGSLLHRGQANNGKVHRFFYYASFACKADANTGNV